MTRELDAYNIEAKDANIQDATLLHIMTKELDAQNIEAKDANIKVVTIPAHCDNGTHCKSHHNNRCQHQGCNSTAQYDNRT